MTSNQVTQSRFGPDRLLRIAEIERRHFWFVGRRELLHRLIARYLTRQAHLILDLGCGTGMMTESLMRMGYQVIGSDLRPEGLSALHRGVPESRVMQAEATRLPVKNAAVGAVLLLDVLEHAEDRALLAEVHRVLRPRGWAIIAVPAMPWLWSYRDHAAGHLRRYTRAQFRRLLEEADLEIREMRYYQCLLFPILMITRLLGRRGPLLRDWEESPGPILNALLTWINRFEVRTSRLVPWPWGSSLVAVCRKIPG